jgi:hypothetical protein
MKGLQQCAHCLLPAKCRRREFSAQAWSALLAWGEIESDVIDDMICDDCYSDLRDILIDNEAALAAPATASIAPITSNSRRASNDNIEISDNEIYDKVTTVAIAAKSVISTTTKASKTAKKDTKKATPAVAVKSKVVSVKAVSTKANAKKKTSTSKTSRKKVA